MAGQITQIMLVTILFLGNNHWIPLLHDYKQCYNSTRTSYVTAHTSGWS